MMTLIKQKMTWIGIAAVLMVVIVFGAAMLGSVLDVMPKDLPVALVVADQAASFSTGEELAVGKLLQQSLTSHRELPVTWIVIGSEVEARAGLNEHKYYGALVLPEDMSRGVLSLVSASPQPPTVKVLVNEGMNVQASTVVRQLLGQVMREEGKELSTQLLSQIGLASGEIPVDAAKALLSPLVVQEETIHNVGVNNGSGNAPGFLIQIMWMGSLATGFVLFLGSRKSKVAGASGSVAAMMQALMGVAITGLASGLLTWMASSWYGMELRQLTDTWLFLWLVGSAFFALQSSFLNWIGFPAMGILILLMFFSMPILNMAPEMLSHVSRFWLYSWTPLRFAASGLREVMYFGGLHAVSSNAAVLWSIGGVFIALLLASGLKKPLGAAKAKSVADLSHKL